MPARPLLLVALTMCVAVSVTAQQPPQQTFRSGVDLILLEATVLDKDGRPIGDLQAKDFSVKLGGKVRTVAVAEYIPAGKLAAASSSATATAAAPAAAGPSSVETARAQLASTERTIILAIDVDNIRSGAGRNAFVDIAEYVATLPATDRIGVITLPFGGTTVQPTADRAAIMTALSRMAGVDHRSDSCDATIGEAAADAVNDSRGLASFAGRVSPPRCPPGTSSLLKMFSAIYRGQTLQTLRTLTSLAESMAVLPGRRTIVLVSEGLYMDLQITQEMSAFGRALERSRVVLYAIHLDFPFTEASQRFNITATRRLDDRYGFDGMADAAFFGGGAAMRAISRATPAIRRIDNELAGTYLLGVERLPGDPDGKQMSLKVEITRKGAEVRARRDVTIGGK